MAPSLLSVSSGIAPVYRRPLISVGKVPGGMEDQLSALGHQRKFNFVHRIGYLVVVVVYPVEEKDHWNIELGKIVMVRTIIKLIRIVFCIECIIQ